MRITSPRVMAKACGLLVIGLLGGLALTPTPADGQVLSGRVSDPRMAMTVATYNTAGWLPTSTAVADLTKLAGTGVDVMTLQEMGQGKRRKAVNAALVDCSTCKYDAFMPSTAAENATPILYRWDKFQLIGSGSQQVSQATYVGARGAGPSTLKAKFINWVELRHRASGQTVYILNNHSVPSVQGPDGGSNDTMPERLALYAQHMDGLRTLVTQFNATGSPVLVTGDLNVNYRRDKIVRDPLFPYVTMHQVGLRSSFEALGEPALGTHGTSTRLIDYVGAPYHSAATPTSEKVLTGYHSDHRPLVVTFTMTSRY